MLTVSETMNSFLNLLRDKVEGGPFSRFKSWEYCHLAFLNAKNRELNEDDIDILALHLSFYLASWGMYRGSSFILQRDYKTHKNIVRIVLKDEYRDLWDFDPVDKSDMELLRIARIADRAYQEIDRSGYGVILERNILDEGTAEDDIDNEHISITLVTKILMGTFAITPAFDRFFSDGLIKYNNAHHTKGSSYCVDRLVKLFKFAQANINQLNAADVVTDFIYPTMKKVDMYFWEVGYEFGFIASLKELIKHLDENQIDNIIDTKKLKVFKKLIIQISSFAPEVNDLRGTHRQIITAAIDIINRRVTI